MSLGQAFERFMLYLSVATSYRNLKNHQNRRIRVYPLFGGYMKMKTSTGTY